MPAPLFIVALLANIWSLILPTGSWAGCGCDKPPPAPAIVIPHAAFPGMPVTFSDSNLQVGQTWTINFQQQGTTVASATATVIQKRDLTDPSGTTFSPQMNVTLPEMPVGPTQIALSSTNGELIVPDSVFTVVAKPLLISEQNKEYEMSNYTTAVGIDGTVYMSVGGLGEVCKAISFQATLANTPLRVQHIIIINAQGFYIDTLHAPNAAHFAVVPQQGTTSDTLYYFRHSFAEYCASHLPGGAKEVDPVDPNWHRDGTPHVDYSTLIFAIAAKLPDGALPQPGSLSSQLDGQSLLGDGTGAWEVEQPAEMVSDDDDDDDGDDD
ncbi:MAG: hypothetical protein FJ147_24710 [Deltaproteobacteria bacterium]|nr:hypothetical protein [Deltaproteobacteria bacterium]